MPILKLDCDVACATLQVCEWVESLKVPSASFRTNDVDGELLAALDADDLKELGGLTDLHIKKLGLAINKLMK